MSQSAALQGRNQRGVHETGDETTIRHTAEWTPMERHRTEKPARSRHSTPGPAASIRGLKNPARTRRFVRERGAGDRVRTGNWSSATTKSSSLPRAGARGRDETRRIDAAVHAATFASSSLSLHRQWPWACRRKSKASRLCHRLDSVFRPLRRGRRHCSRGTQLVPASGSLASQLLPGPFARTRGYCPLRIPKMSLHRS